MLNPGMISKLVVSERPVQLLDALISNGLYLPAAVRNDLTTQGMTAVLGLGLRRMLELARRPHPLAESLLDELLSRQADDGSFDHDPLATAITLAALRQAMVDLPGQRPALEPVCGRAMLALQAMQDTRGRFHPNQPGTALNWEILTAYILQLLSPDPAARQALNLQDVLEQFEKATQQHQPDVQSCLRIARACMRTTAVAA